MAHFIPPLIHQTWRDTAIPEAWRKFQRSWSHHHPNWEYRLWTDLDLRNLIREHYPWFLSIYDNYPEPIQRVDAARYFLLHQFGGIYADLDFECLRPVEPLLTERGLVLSDEPKEHLSKPVIQAHGLTQLVGNALMASQPRHPFWEHVFLELVGAHRMPGPLSSTGPIFLTRALQSYPASENISSLPSSLLYPGTSDEAQRGLLLNADWRAKNTTHSYAIHHWSGSWIDRAKPDVKASDARRIPFTLVDRGKPLLNGNCELSNARGSTADLVSCLMVTRSRRLGLARRAIACFQAQTYTHSELVIIDDGDDGTEDELLNHVNSLADPRIKLVRLAPERKPLGALRNIAVALAEGTYVMQWDDDDLYHPRRIEIQMGAIQALGADACFLSRWRIWWPAQRRLATSKRRCWEGSMLCSKKKLPRYDESKMRGEDTPVVLKLASREKVAIIDTPWLYTYVVHGDNTTPGSSLEEHWHQATEFHWGGTYVQGLQSIARALPDPLRSELIEQAGTEAQKPNQRRPQIPAPARKPSGMSSDGNENDPRVLILSPVKNGMPFIDSFFKGISRLDYPPDRLSLGLLESDSVDGTYSVLSQRLREVQGRYSRAELFKRDYGLNLAGHRANSETQLQRRSILARSRNYLLSRALNDEDWVLWLDFDVIDYPSTLIQELLSTRKDIVVPHCVLAPGGRTFDLNTFVQTEACKTSDMLLQPARGVGRKYLEELREQDLVKVDGVGGTALLIRADLHREGLIFPAVPYKQTIETEGLAYLARDLGIQSWGVPKLEVIHANH